MDKTDFVDSKSKLSPSGEQKADDKRSPSLAGSFGGGIFAGMFIADLLGLANSNDHDMPIVMQFGFTTTVALLSLYISAVREQSTKTMIARGACVGMVVMWFNHTGNYRSADLAILMGISLVNLLASAVRLISLHKSKWNKTPKLFLSLASCAAVGISYSIVQIKWHHDQPMMHGIPEIILLAWACHNVAWAFPIKEKQSRVPHVNS
jgi:hypothetical protein